MSGFDGKWMQSEDYKPDLIETLRASKFGSKPYTPFEVFMNALFEILKERILLDAGPRGHGGSRTLSGRRESGGSPPAG